MFLHKTSLDRRTIGALNRAGITTVSELIALPERELFMLPGIGKLSLEAISKLKILWLLPTLADGGGGNA